MSIVFGAIAPHGFSIIEEIAGEELESFKPIREGMVAFGRRIKKHQIDTIIILTPHGLRITEHNAVYLTETCRGTISQFGKSVSLDYSINQELANTLYNDFKEAKAQCQVMYPIFLWIGV